MLHGRWVTTLVIATTLAAIGAVGPASAAPRDDADKPLGPSTESRVRAVSRGADDPLQPGTSRSVGLCGEGYLVNGVPLPAETEAVRHIPSYRERGLHWGTAELIAFIERVGQSVRARFPETDTVLGVGNLSGHNGGPIRYSQSHQAGRDVDFAFYAVDTEGNPAFWDGLLHFRCNLKSRSEKGAYRFDVARNWALVEALVTDPEVDVQLVFIAPCLRRTLLDHAESVGAPEEARRRAGAVLRAAGGHSYVHDDHFHVRLLCSREDLLTGCRNTGRIWPWSRVHEEALHDEQRALGRQLRSADATVRTRTLDDIARLDCKDLASRAARLVEDPDASVQERAHACLRALASNGALPYLRRRARETRDTSQLLTLLETMTYFEGPSPKTAHFLESVLNRPDEAIAARLNDEQLRTAQLHAIHALRYVGRRGSMWALIRKLDATDETLRQAAEEAVAYLVNRPVDTREDETLRQRRRRWSEWWKEARRRSFDRVLRDGFRRAGVDIERSLFRWQVVRPLLLAVREGGWLSWNAQRVLRRFARENAPRIPRKHPEAAYPIWKAWVGSRLPAGALDGLP